MEQLKHPIQLCPVIKIDSQNHALAEIRQLLGDYAQLARQGHIPEIMKLYSEDIVAFDMMPPLQFKSGADYEKAWEECFTTPFIFPLNFDFSDQKICTEGDFAFTHSLVHVVGTMKNGRTIDSWLRNTMCLKKQTGQWKIIHEHNSVPIDENGKAMMDLKPESPLH